MGQSWDDPRGVSVFAPWSEPRPSSQDLVRGEESPGTLAGERNLLAEAVLLYGENRDLGDPGNDWGRPARAGGDVFLAVSSWGYHIVSCWDRGRRG